MIPESIKQYAQRVAFENVYWVTEDDLDRERQRVIEAIGRYKEVKENFFKAKKEQQDVIDWAKSNNLLND